MPTIIRLLPYEVELARSWEAAILATGIERVPNYTNFSKQNRFLIGYLGELAVARLLVDDWGVTCEHNVELTGRTSTKPDFTITVPPDSLTVDLEVKTAGEPYHRLMTYPHNQVERSGKPPADFYVGCRLEECDDDGALVSIWGWLTGAEAEALPASPFDTGGEAVRKVKLNALHDLSELRRGLGAAVSDELELFPFG